MSKIHSAHPEIIARLKRANGHLSKVIEMVEMERPCLEVAQQLQAVSQAVNKAKRLFVQQHIEECLDDSVLGNSGDAKKQLADFKEITKYL